MIAGRLLIVLSLLYPFAVIYGAAPATLSENGVLGKYRPIAMDESWKVVNPARERKFTEPDAELVEQKPEFKGYSYIYRPKETNLPDFSEFAEYAAKTSTPPPSVKPTIRILRTTSSSTRRPTAKPTSTKTTKNLSNRETVLISPGGHTKMKLAPEAEKDMFNVGEWSDGANPHRIYHMPRSNESFPSKVITSDKDAPTTFLSTNVIQPELRAQKGQEKSNGTLLARYRLIIPLFLPALKKKDLPSPTEKPVKYVQEVVTEMIPVKKTVPHVREVVKAEPVPQSLITDFIVTDRHRLPQTVDDKVKPNEKVLASVVQNVD